MLGVEYSEVDGIAIALVHLEALADERLNIFLAARSHDEINLAPAQSNGRGRLILYDLKQNGFDRRWPSEIDLVPLQDDAGIDVAAVEIVRPRSYRVPANLLSS